MTYKEIFEGLFYNPQIFQPIIIRPASEKGFDAEKASYCHNDEAGMRSEPKSTSPTYVETEEDGVFKAVVTTSQSTHNVEAEVTSEDDRERVRRRLLIKIMGAGIFPHKYVFNPSRC